MDNNSNYNNNLDPSTSMVTVSDKVEWDPPLFPTMVLSTVLEQVELVELVEVAVVTGKVKENIVFKELSLKSFGRGFWEKEESEESVET